MRWSEDAPTEVRWTLRSRSRQASCCDPISPQAYRTLRWFRSLQGSHFSFCMRPTTMPGAMPISHAKAVTAFAPKRPFCCTNSVSSRRASAGAISQSHAKRSASASAASSSSSSPSTNWSFFPWSSRCAASWKNVNQRWSFVL